MRTARIDRTTKETSISVSIALDAAEPLTFNFGIPFLEHMLHAMAFHGGFSLTVEGSGDLAVDPHHLVEDIGLVLGEALRSAIGDSAIQRYGNDTIPMDDALSQAVIDICKRPYLVYNANFPQAMSGTFDMSLFREFFQAFANRAELNLHVNCHYGNNSHHMIEALFKAFGRSLHQATRLQASGRIASTKGSL